jgi:hypothetical protein
VTQSYDAMQFYAENYKIAAGWCLRPGVKLFLGDKNYRKCRFCGRSTPDTNFRNEAHAIPNCIGNKSLFVYYECDACNQRFGSGCENDFGNWSLPMRMMSRICGKTGIPTVKQGPNGIWRIDASSTGLTVNIDAEEGFYERDELTKTLTFHLRRAPYRPAMIVQTMVKIALSIMPDNEMANFQCILEWIRPDTPALALAAPTPFIHNFIGGPMSSDLLTVAVLTRQSDNLPTWYSCLLLMYGHELLQMVIPSIERDQHLYGKQLDFPPFPLFPDDDSGAARPIHSSRLPFSTMEFVKNDSFDLEIGYQEQRAGQRPSGSTPL